MEELQARHRKEQRDLQSRMTQKKKQASKKTRKGVNDECTRLEAELQQQQAAELAAFNGDAVQGLDAGVQDLSLETEKDVDTSDSMPQDLQNQHIQDSSANDDTHSEAAIPSQSRKPNRQKARLARRAAEQDDLARQAAEEAQNLPDMKQQERERMLAAMKEHGLQEREIRADGHCLYSAVVDQLDQVGIPLGTTPGDKPSLERYKLARVAAADYIEEHKESFEPFLEESLVTYVHKVRDTAQWGGQLELMALARRYRVRINVLQDFGRVEKIEPDGEEKTLTDQKSLWLGYYKHGFGLGEHYNSLRKAG